ncbi:MAG: hypothetical protein ABIR62_17525, partial [Dokdonella sp.]|uniref:hypothetical protein n=1 Tax=Dokdonella sp. TaxID=2291710 RepID=UPI0032678CDC
MKRLALCAFIAAACGSTAYAGTIEKTFKANTATGQQTWSAWGGSMGMRWNHDLLQNLGVKLDSATAKVAITDYRQHEWFQVRQTDGLQFSVKNGSLQQFNGGSLQMRGGYVLHLNDGSTIDLRDFSLRVRASDPKILDLVSSDGKVWFFSDRVMFELADGNRTLAIRAADLRVTAALAARLGAPESEGWELADMAMNTEVNIVGADPEPDRVCSPTPWPGVAVPNHAGSVYQADLFMQSFSVSPTGCLTCTGPDGSGTASFAPSSTLVNNKNDGTAVATIAGDPLGTSAALYTANVAWYSKFSGNNAPYNNDQHPYLIWNLYRINANTGVIEQVGRSGVKHAFLTINQGCMDSCFDSHALGLGCGDTYGVGNNDSPGDMGPRSEIIPATGQWGRCGSIFDPNCDGSQDSSGNTAWTQRLKTPEGKLKHASGDGVTFLFESWYAARGDINIYNSMATETVNPQFSGSQWSLTGGSNYRLGAAVDRWVDPSAPPANSMNTELAVAEGHAKVAVKVTDLGGGKWRYNYAVQNLDFSRATTSGAEPNLRVLSNKGFDSLSIPLPAGREATGRSAYIGDANPNMNWRSQVTAGAVNF